MKKHLLLAAVLLTALTTVRAQGPNNSGKYYQGANGLKGKTLKTKLADIIVNPRNVGYDGLYEAYKKTDTRADGFVRDWYSNATNYRHGVDNKGNYSKEGDMYNREHSVPQSWFGSGGIKSDIVHVLPTDGYVNNRRGNYPFGEVNVATYTSQNGYSKLGSCKTAGYSGTVFEPNDEIKGDIARIYFYMITRYESSCGSWGHDVFTSSYPGLTQWTLDMMMRWSQQDPVDEVETARNNAVYEVQGNRNPYVDYPGLEEYTWGSKTEQAFSYDNYGGDVLPDDGGGTTPDDGGGTTPDDGGGEVVPPVDGQLALNNALFGTTYTGSIPKSDATDLKGMQNGVTVVYALGEGSNRYCNDQQIRLYPGNTLTLSVDDGRLTALTFTLGGTTNNSLNANTGSVTENSKWEGDASSVTFTCDGSSGHIKLESVQVTVTGTTDISGLKATVTAPVVYDLQGRRVAKPSKGVYIVNGKKTIIR